MAVATTKFDEQCTEFWDKLTWNKGSLCFKQFYKTFQQVGVNLSLKDLKTQWDIIDTDNSDDMDLQEFKVLMKSHFEATDNKVILQNAFNKIYGSFYPNDVSDLLSYRTETPRIANKNVKVVINKSTMKQNKKFQDALDKKLTEVFKAIDIDNSGTLEFDEMWQAVKLLEIPISYQDLKLTYDFFDTDKNGAIEEDEFKRWMNSQVTKYWSDNPDNNQFVALQRMVSSKDVVSVLSTRASTNQNEQHFSFKDVADNIETKENNNNNNNNIYENCTINDVVLWDVNKIADYIGYLFSDKQYDECRDQYVAIFMTRLIDGKKFMKLGRMQISHMGIVTAKGKRHVSVIKNAQRYIKKRSAK
eukprot:182884_1